MPVKITTKGLIELWRGITKVSSHSIETEAIERATADYEATGTALYTLKYPNKEIDLSRLTRVIRDVDATRPNAPTGLAGVPFSETSINLSWNAATDPQGISTEAVSGVVGYRLYRDGSIYIIQAGTTYSDLGCAPYTVYTYQVSSYDAAGNESLKSALISPRTLDQTAPTAPVITATQTGQTSISVALTTASTDTRSGVATYALEYKRNADSTWTVAAAALTAGQFPRAISGLTAGTLYNTRARATDVSGNVGSYSATSQATTQSAGSTSAADAEWNRRRAWPGVTFDSDFSDASDFVLASTNGGHVFGDLMAPAILARVVKDTTDGLSNGCCLRIDTPVDAGSNSAAWMFSLNRAWTTNAQSFGSAEFFISYAMKLPASRLSLSNCGGLQRGWKWMNVAQYSPTNTESQSFSNTLAEIVGQDTDQRGIPQAYHRDTNASFPPFQGSAGGQITLQPARDLGPDFSGGNRYCWYDTPTPGCVFWPIDEWFDLMFRIKIPSYNGSAGNEFDMYIARATDTCWVPLFRERNFSLGSPNSNGGGFTGHTGAHLLTYETNRVGTSSGNVATYHKYDQPLVGTARLPVPRRLRTAGSTLATTIAAMSPGTWQQFTPSNNQNTFLGVGSVSGSMIHFCNSMEWNERDQCIEIIGEDHNYGSMRHVRFNESTNSFSLVSNDIGIGSSAQHGYDHSILNPLTDDIYFRGAEAGSGAYQLRRKPYGGSTYAAMPSTGSSEYFQFAIGHCWWSGEFTGGSTWSSQGLLMVFNSGNSVGSSTDGQILAFNPITRTWVYNQTSMAPNYGTGETYHSIMEYSTRKNVAIYGGGNAAPRKLWRLNSDGTKTTLTSAPASVAIGMQNGIICEDPITGNFLLLSSGELWELNPESAGTWTQQTGSRAPPAGVGNPAGGGAADGMFCCALPKHGAIAYVRQTSTTGGTFYLYKHAA